MITRPGTQDEATLREAREYALLQIQPGDVCLDLGGCIGAFGRIAADIGASVVAVEPETSNADLYRQNVPEALVLEAAVTDEDGWAQLWLGSTNSHSIDRRRGRTPGELVATRSLPSLLAEFHPTILKADIEGSEYMLDWSNLEGVREVAMELHFTPKRAWRQLGYDLVAVIDGQGFEQIRPFRDTGQNWHCTVVWRRET